MADKKEDKTEESQNFWKITTLVLVCVLVYIAFLRGPSIPSQNIPQPVVDQPTNDPQLADGANDPVMALTIVKPKDCTTCDTTEVETALKKVFPKTAITYVDYESAAGKKLVEQTKVNALPLYVYDSSVAKGANYAKVSQAFQVQGDLYVLPPGVVGATYVLNPPSVDNDPMKGKANAKVTIIEFSDFQCPYCGKFYTETLPQIMKEYIDTGKAKLVYRDYPLEFHPNAQPAAEAAECAHEQGKFWEMHNKLFENQQSLSVDNYKQWAADLKLDTKKFNDCVDTHKYADEVKKDAADGSAAGVSGTPGFFVNNKIISGAVPFEVFKQTIDAELAK